MVLVFHVDVIDSLLNVKAIVDQSKNLGEVKSSNGVNSLRFSDSEVFGFKVIVNFSFLFEIKKVSGDHFSEGID